jgi:hypothetical protein
MSRGIVFVLAAVALALLTATAVPAGDGKEQIKFNAADQAAARAVVIRRADLGSTGWAGGPTKPDLSSGPTCANYHPKVSDLVLTGAALRVRQPVRRTEDEADGGARLAAVGARSGRGPLPPTHDRQGPRLDRKDRLVQEAPVPAACALRRSVSRSDRSQCAGQDRARSHRPRARRAEPHRAHIDGCRAGLRQERAFGGRATPGPCADCTRTRVRPMGRVRVAAVACACLLLAACGGTTKQSSIRRATANSLASTSDAVAAALQRGDSCGAATQAQALRRQVAAAIASGAIPGRFATPARRTATHLASSIRCTPPSPTPPRPAPATCAPQKSHQEQKQGDDEDKKGPGDELRRHHRKGCK